MSVLLAVGLGLALGVPAASAGRVSREVAEQLEREVAACQVRLDEVRDRSDRCSEDSPPPAIYTELVQTFADSEVMVHREGPHVMVVLPGELLFPPTDNVLRGEAAFAIDLLGTALALHPDVHAWVVGHIHDGPLVRNMARDYPDRWTLSYAQAGVVQHALQTGANIPASRFTVSARGTTMPLSEGDSPEGRAQNHRVVVVLAPPDPWR